MPITSPTSSEAKRMYGLMESMKEMATEPEVALVATIPSLMSLVFIG